MAEQADLVVHRLEAACGERLLLVVMALLHECPRVHQVHHVVRVLAHHLEKQSGNVTLANIDDNSRESGITIGTNALVVVIHK